MGRRTSMTGIEIVPSVPDDRDGLAVAVLRFSSGLNGRSLCCVRRCDLAGTGLFAVVPAHPVRGFAASHNTWLAAMES